MITTTTSIDNDRSSNPTTLLRTTTTTVTKPGLFGFLLVVVILCDLILSNNHQQQRKLSFNHRRDDYDDDRIFDDYYDDILFEVYMFWSHVVVAVPIIINSFFVPLYVAWVILILSLRYMNDKATEAAIIDAQIEEQRQKDLAISTTSSTADGHIGRGGVLQESESQISQPINMSGSYQLVKNVNFEAFLATQGVPWALRGAANRARPKHIITHVGNSITIQICGIIESSTTYEINGPPNRCNVRGRVFEDTVTYLNDGTGIQTLKHAIYDHYKISVVRQLSPDKSKLTLTSTATFDENYVDGPNKEPIQSIQFFERIVQ